MANIRVEELGGREPKFYRTSSFENGVTSEAFGMSVPEAIGNLILASPRTFGVSFTTGPVSAREPETATPNRCCLLP